VIKRIVDNGLNLKYFRIQQRYDDFETYKHHRGVTNAIKVLSHFFEKRSDILSFAVQ